MSETDRTERSPKGRWYDQYKVTMTLFAIVGFFIIAWGGFVFVKVNAATEKNVTQDEQLNGVGKSLDRIDKAQEKMDVKLDRVLERIPKTPRDD